MTSIEQALDERARLWIMLRELEPEILELTRLIVNAIQRGGRMFFAGNGGSAADAQHLAAEYVGVGLPAMALTTDTSVLTALGNDFGYRDVFSRQATALCDMGDVVVMHSTSGNSENLVYLALEAGGRGVSTVALLARGGGHLLSRVDLPIVVPTNSTPLAQEAHLAIGHIVFNEVTNLLRPPLRAPQTITIVEAARPE